MNSTRLGWVSLICTGLAISITTCAYYGVVLLGERDLLGWMNPLGLWFLFIAPAVLLVTLGDILAIRGIRGKTGSKAIAITGLIINIGLSSLLLIYIVWNINFFFVKGKIEGHITINGEPPPAAELFLTEKCSNEVRHDDPSTWCYNDFAHGAQLVRDGSFTFWYLQPGEYKFHVWIEIPSDTTCRSALPGFDISSQEAYGQDSVRMLVKYNEALTIPEGAGQTDFVRVALECKQQK